MSSSDHVLNIFRLLVPSATPGATFDFSAPSPWKQVGGLVVFGDSKRHQDDFGRFVAKWTLLSAQRNLRGGTRWKTRNASRRVQTHRLLHLVHSVLSDGPHPLRSVGEHLRDETAFGHDLLITLLDRFERADHDVRHLRSQVAVAHAGEMGPRDL